MNTEELKGKIDKFLEENSDTYMTSSIMYDPIKLQKEISFVLYEKDNNGLKSKFLIKIEDVEEIDNSNPIDPDLNNIYKNFFD